MIFHSMTQRSRIYACWSWSDNETSTSCLVGWWRAGEFLHRKKWSWVCQNTIFQLTIKADKQRRWKKAPQTSETVDHHDCISVICTFRQTVDTNTEITYGFIPRNVVFHFLWNVLFNYILFTFGIICEDILRGLLSFWNIMGSCIDWGSSQETFSWKSIRSTWSLNHEF